MIRIMKKTDISQIVKIWLDTNRKAHDFISAQYWMDHLPMVQDMLPKAEVYVYIDEKNNKLEGFIGLNADYIAGLFVCFDAQSRGIGKQLLDTIKLFKKQLQLNVYKKNIRAVAFYQREGFQIESENIDENTGEAEYAMKWEKADDII